MRRIDRHERIAAEANGHLHPEDIAWLIARIRRLEAALDAARVRVPSAPSGDPSAGWEYRVPGRGALDHNAAIDAALAGDP